MKNSFAFNIQRTTCSVETANQFIELVQQLSHPTQEQQAMLANAHFTLACHDATSFNLVKLHLNSAIALFQNLTERPVELTGMMAEAYFKRAALFEYEEAYASAFLDYQKILDIFEADNTNLEDPHKLLLAQTAISMADLILNQTHLFPVHQKPHPLFYINQSLQYLTELPGHQEEICPTMAYAHQIAGLALTAIDGSEAKEAFRTAINLLFKTEPLIACEMLGDIYNSLGLLYEQERQDCPICVLSKPANEHALIYFTLALFFTPEEEIQSESDSLNQIFETIYRCLDPFLTPLSSTVLKNLIDGLIFTYYCVNDNILPNETLNQQLAEKENFNNFAHHILSLVSESFRRDHFYGRLLDVMTIHESDLFLDLENSLDSLLEPQKNKVHYL